MNDHKLPDSAPHGSLAYLWARTNAVKIVSMPRANMAILRITDDVRPITLMDGNGWLAEIPFHKSEGQWEVGVWYGQMTNQNILTDERDRLAGQIIEEIVKGNAPSEKIQSSEAEWIPVTRSLPPMQTAPSP